MNVMGSQEEFIRDPDINVIPHTPGKKTKREFYYKFKNINRSIQLI